MTTITDPNPVVDIAAALLECLCTQVNTIAPARRPQHCRYGLGAEQAHDLSLGQDMCCEGIAYVTLLDTFWSVETFPEPDIVRQISGDCPPPAWAQKFGVGIIRCSPVGDLNAVPTDAAWNAAALIDMEDSWVLRRVACCIRTWMTEQTGRMLGMSLFVGAQTVKTPEGGCIERSFEVTAQLPNEDCGC